MTTGMPGDGSLPPTFNGLWAAIDSFMMGWDMTITDEQVSWGSNIRSGPGSTFSLSRTIYVIRLDDLCTFTWRGAQGDTSVQVQFVALVPALIDTWHLEFYEDETKLLAFQSCLSGVYSPVDGLKVPR